MHLKAASVRTGRVPFSALWPFLLIAFGWAWGLNTLFVFLPRPMTLLFGELAGHHPLFILSRGSILLLALVHFQANNPL